MKIFAFNILLTLLVGPLVAQNTTYVNQMGENNQATVAQSMGVGNSGTVDHYGDGNENIIGQLGAGNTATQITNDYLLGDGTTDNHTMSIATAGLNNNAEMHANGLLTGAGNIMIIAQTGNSNQARVDVTNRTGLGNTVFGNTGTIIQTSNSNLAEIEQIDQMLGFATIHQHNGDGNHAKLSQSNALMSNAIIVQNGADNSTQLNQSGGGILDVLQFGISNMIMGLYLNCIMSDWAEFSGLFLNVDQMGENNELYLNAKGNVTVMQNNMGTAGNGNTIKYYQSGTGITSLTQSGDDNFIGLIHGGNGNVDVVQVGNDNKIGNFVDVFADDPQLDNPCCGKFSGTIMDVDQIGTGNYLHLNSTGLNDVVNLNQEGLNNRASITQ